MARSQFGSQQIGMDLMYTVTQQSTSLLPKDKRSFFRNILIYLFFPVVIPIAIFRSIRKFREKFGLRKRPLEGKVVLITGASSGIGEALAHRLYLAGCKLILTSRRVKELERVKSELVKIQTYGPVYIPATMRLDLEDLKGIKDKSSVALAIYGQVDILINNAGVSYRGNVLNTEIELDQKIMTINYFGPLALTKFIAKAMVQRRSGHIMFISSVQGKIAIPHRSAYAASKHATQALADCLRAELSSSGVGLTVISPGYVQTNLSYNALTDAGIAYGKMDATTAGGFSSDYVAERSVRALMNNEKEVTIASLIPRIVILIRNISPSFFFNLMAGRVES